MAKSKSELANETLLAKYRPTIADVKRSDYLPNPNLFTKEKTFIYNGVEKKIKVDWIQWVIGGAIITLHEGINISVDDLQMIKAADALDYFAVKAKAKPTKQ